MKIKFLMFCFVISLFFNSCSTNEINTVPVEKTSTELATSSQIVETEEVVSTKLNDKSVSDIKTTPNKTKIPYIETTKNNKPSTSLEEIPVLKITADLVETTTNDDGSKSKKYNVTASLVYKSSGKLYSESTLNVGFLTGGKPRHESKLIGGTTSFEFFLTPDMPSESIRAVVVESPWGVLESETSLD